MSFEMTSSIAKLSELAAPCGLGCDTDEGVVGVSFLSSKKLSDTLVFKNRIIFTTCFI